MPNFSSIFFPSSASLTVFIKASLEVCKILDLMPLNALFTNIRENAVVATMQLLNNLKIQVTATTIAETLQEHLDYPSLLSISDALNQWGINNMCLRVDPEKLNELPVPFIAHLAKKRWVVRCCN